MKRVVTTIEARMGSSRLPGKVLKEAVGKPMLLLMVERVCKSRYVDEAVVATTSNEKDEAIATLCREHNISYFRGSEGNVLERVVKARQQCKAVISVLLTGDSPLIDPYVIDQHVCALFAAYPHVDYVANCEVRSYPHEMDLQVRSISQPRKIDQQILEQQRDVDVRVAKLCKMAYFWVIRLFTKTQ